MDKIGDYWLDQETSKITNLLKEYEDVFTMDYNDLKLLFQEMGEMKIGINPDSKPVYKWPYKLSHKYKDIIKKEIENMLAVGIIYLVG